MLATFLSPGSRLSRRILATFLPHRTIRDAIACWPYQPFAFAPRIPILLALAYLIAARHAFSRLVYWRTTTRAASAPSTNPLSMRRLSRYGSAYCLYTRTYHSASTTLFMHLYSTCGRAAGLCRTRLPTCLSYEQTFPGRGRRGIAALPGL